MVVLAIVKGGQTNGARAFNGVLGAAFLGYAFYLEFIFQGGHIIVFYYAFILPFLMVIRFFRARGSHPNAAQPRAQQPYAGQPYGSQPYGGQPGQVQPYPGQQYPGQQYPGQPYPGQPGQGYPGQPGQGYPGQQPPPG